jgi:hypothetical protein
MRVKGCGVPLVLKSTRGREPELLPELATAAAMWRPRRRPGQRGEGKRAPARVGVGPGGCGGAACGGGAVGDGLSAFLSGGGAILRRRQRKQREREEEDDRLDLFANSKKFRGPTVKQK